MAITTFTGNTNTGSNYTLYLQVEEVDISESANTSKLKYRAYLIGSSATSAYSGYSNGLTLTINVGDSSNATRYGNKTRQTIMDFGYGGVTCRTYYCNWNDSTGGNPNSTHTVSAMMGLSDWWTTNAISHEDDGNKTLKLKFTVSSLSGLVGSGTISTDFNMATIARASSVSFDSSSYTISSSSSTAVPTTITKSSTEFYHKLEYYIGSTSSAVKKTAYITKNSSSSVSDSSIKYSDLLGWITSTNKTNLYVVCTTYSDSNYTNSVGTSNRSTEIKITITASITAAAAATDWRSSLPLGSSQVSQLSSDLSTGIAGYSTLTLNSLSINIPTGATSLSFGTPSFTNGVTGKITIVSSTTSNYTIKIETNTLPLKTDYYTSTVTSVVTDSRGNPVTLTLGTLAVAGYTKPTVTSIAVNRAPDTTSTITDAAGLYFRVSCLFNPGIIKVNSSTYHAINGYSIKYTIGNNTTTLSSGSCSAGTGAGSFNKHTGNPTGSDRVGDNPRIGIEETANITFSISDTFTGYSLLPLATAIVNTARFPLDLSDNGSGVVGVGLGTIAESNKLKIGNLPLDDTSGRVVIGVSTQSTLPSSSIGVHDIRNVTLTPTHGNKGANFYFFGNADSINTRPSTDSVWWSLLHVKGWEGSYGTWEIAGNSTNNDTTKTTPLYVRGGLNTSWGSWRKIYDSGNKPTASEVGAPTTTAFSNLKGRFNIMCYANSIVSTFSDGQITLTTAQLGCSGVKPVGILLTPEYSSDVTMHYMYDSSSTTNVIIKAWKNGTAFSGALRFFAVVFAGSWQSTLS